MRRDCNCNYRYEGSDFSEQEKRRDNDCNDRREEGDFSDFSDFDNCGKTRQLHVHEFSDSVFIAERGEDAHNHRVAGVSGPAIPIHGSHVHKVAVRTDYYEDHYHVIAGTSGPAVPVGNGKKHVHYLQGKTTRQEGHDHDFAFAALIADPIAK